MKTLNLKEMEVIEAGKLCSSDGYAVWGGAWAVLSGPVGVAMYAGMWIGCSID